MTKIREDVRLKVSHHPTDFVVEPPLKTESILSLSIIETLSLSLIPTGA